MKRGREKEGIKEERREVGCKRMREGRRVNISQKERERKWNNEQERTEKILERITRKKELKDEGKLITIKDK